MAVGDDKIADFTIDNYAAAEGNSSVADPRNIGCSSTSEFFVLKALMTFPKGSSAGLDGILT